MIIAILQFEMLIPEPESLKDKRRVVRSVKDRLHRDFQCAVAEVSALDNPNVARMGLAIVSNDGKHAAQVLDRITERLRAWPDAHLGDCRREIVHGHGASDEVFDGPEPSEDEIADELLRRSMDDPELAALERATRRAGVPDGAASPEAGPRAGGGRP